MGYPHLSSISRSDVPLKTIQWRYPHDFGNPVTALQSSPSDLCTWRRFHDRPRKPGHVALTSASGSEDVDVERPKL
jgi:hypothetical protein